MVAVAHRDADKFIASQSSSLDTFLVFGPDSGLVIERTIAILKQAGYNVADHDQVTRLDGDAIAGDPGLLFDEAHSTGLFAEKRALVIRAGSRQFTAAVETALNEPVSGCKIVIQAGALRKDAPLRILLTRARNGAAIECYPDQTKDIERLIDTEVQAARLQIDPGARSALVGLLGDDRLSTRAELEKLLLYTHGQANITEIDVINSVADASAFALENLVYAAFSGKLVELGSDSAPLFSATGEANSLISLIQRHVHMLHAARCGVDSGLSPEVAIERTGGRTVFGLRRDMLGEQVRIWPQHHLLQVIEETSRTTLESRVENRLAAAIAIDFLIGIGRRATSLRARRNQRG